MIRLILSCAVATRLVLVFNASKVSRYALLRLTDYETWTSSKSCQDSPSYDTASSVSPPPSLFAAILRFMAYTKLPLAYFLLWSEQGLNKYCIVCYAYPTRYTPLRRQEIKPIQSRLNLAKCNLRNPDLASELRFVVSSPSPRAKIGRVAHIRAHVGGWGWVGDVWLSYNVWPKRRKMQRPI